MSDDIHKEEKYTGITLWSIQKILTGVFGVVLVTIVWRSVYLGLGQVAPKFQTSLIFASYYAIFTMYLLHGICLVKRIRWARYCTLTLDMLSFLTIFTSLGVLCLKTSNFNSIPIIIIFVCVFVLAINSFNYFRKQHILNCFKGYLGIKSLTHSLCVIGLFVTIFLVSVTHYSQCLRKEGFLKFVYPKLLESVRIQSYSNISWLDSRTNITFTASEEDMNIILKNYDIIDSYNNTRQYTHKLSNGQLEWDSKAKAASYKK